MPSEKELIAERVKKIEELRRRGINPYPYRFQTTATAEYVLKTFDNLKESEESKETASVAGRILGFRRMGKATFCHIQDETGKLQLFFNIAGTKNYENLKYLDNGDWIGAKGAVFKTKTQETTVKVNEYTILCKAIRPLPEKWHGFKDKELRYRRRYIDFVMNPEIKKVFLARTQIINTIRTFLNQHGFTEVETPVLQPLYGGTNAKPFATHYNFYEQEVYLRVAPELYLKRLIVGGFGKVYEIARNFRNEGADLTHNPEFTMLEFYESYADYHRIMDITEELYKTIAKTLYENLKFTIADKTINLSGTWPRLPMKEAIKQHLKIDVEKMTMQQIERFIHENKLDYRGEPSKGLFIYTIFDKLVGPNLQGPIWIIDYPKEISPLAKPHRNDSSFVERFECYVNGMELCDGWSEINDPADQRDRFESEQQALRAGNTEAHPTDEDFIEALEYGMPTLGGIGIGIDRLTMFFTGEESIRDVLLFPFMKPKEDTHKPQHQTAHPEHKHE